MRPRGGRDAAPSGPSKGIRRFAGWRAWVVAHPAAAIMVLAAASRLVAVAWAKGYAMHDDHFCVIEPAQQWVDGSKVPSPDHVPKRNLLYVGVHAALFFVLEALHITDPDAKMLVVRLLHAGWSLAAVWYGMRLAACVDPSIWVRAGLLFAVFWPLPYLSVRTLAEAACLVPLIMAAYWMVRPGGEGQVRHGIMAGMAAALAFLLRYQTAPALLGLALSSRASPKKVGAMGAAFAVVLGLVLGLGEWVVFGAPLATPVRYLAHNLTFARSYVVNPWYTYLGTLIGVFIPPFSLVFLAGFFLAWRRAREVFWPAAAFLLVHSLIPNKQERFIIPSVAFVVIGGCAGLALMASRSEVWRRLIRGLWVWFWILNTVALCLAVTTYGKRSRVEAMRFLRGRQVRVLLVESPRSSVPSLPVFYLGGRPRIIPVTRATGLEELRREVHACGIPDYVIMYGDQRMEERLARLGVVVPNLAYETTILPSLVDRLLCALNPRHNVNERATIYRVVADTGRTGRGEPTS